MRKGDYIRLAETLARNKPRDPTKARSRAVFQILEALLAQWRDDCIAIANVIKEDNPHGFDRDLFLRNCGVIADENPNTGEVPP